MTAVLTGVLCPGDTWGIRMTGWEEVTGVATDTGWAVDTTMTGTEPFMMAGGAGC